MAHPYVKAAHTNDPKWLKGLSQYKEDAAAPADTDRVIVNHGSAPAPTRAASYVKKGD